MIRLQGGTHYLGLTRMPGGEHGVFMCGKFDNALARWSAGTRVSPIFAVNSASSIDFEGDRRKRWILFVGPLYPGDIDPARTPKLFVGVGTYNLVAVSESAKERAAARKALLQKGVSWEEWTVVKGVLVSHEAFEPERPQLAAEHVRVPTGFASALLPTLREYATLMATSLARARVHYDDVATELEAFDSSFKPLLNLKDLPDVTKQGLLVVANAALSRHTSQAYVGITPIRETECQFWTHSLLGIGLGSQALVRVRRFVQRAFDDCRLLDRLRVLGTVPPLAEDLLSLPGASALWEGENLFSDQVERLLPGLAHDSDPLPLLTCFSGRDGFRSTKISLSAPLEVITGCNTTQWTLLTLTHEISHTIVEGALGIILPDVYDVSELTRAIELLDGRRAPASLLEQLSAFVCQSMWQLSSSSSRATLSVDELANVISSVHKDVNETLTHILDFLYFYQGDAALYIRSVWASWGVIPNIQTRVADYVCRTLCALHSNNTLKSQACEVTVGQLLELLKAVAHSHPNEMIGNAVDMLEKQPQHFAQLLQSKLFLVRLAKGFLYQPRVAKKLVYDRLAGSGDKEGYALTASEFTADRIGSPLRFVAAFAVDKSIDPIRSAWMLTQLAFGAPE